MQCIKNMTLSEFEQKIERSINRIESELEAQVAIAGNDLVALITNRVVQKGEDSDGGSFTPYSTTEVPAFFFLGKSKNASAEKKVKDLSAYPDNISYKEFRAINNLNTSPKNFEFTGEMWRGFGVIQVERSPSGAIVTIGGRIKTSEERIKWNSEQEGKSIIKPSKKELEIVTANLNRWINSIING